MIGFLSLKGGCRGSSESKHVKMPHCWKSHATAQLFTLVWRPEPDDLIVLKLMMKWQIV